MLRLPRRFMRAVVDSDLRLPRRFMRAVADSDLRLPRRFMRAVADSDLVTVLEEVLELKILAVVHGARHHGLLDRLGRPSRLLGRRGLRFHKSRGRWCCLCHALSAAKHLLESGDELLGRRRSARRGSPG